MDNIGNNMKICSIMSLMAVALFQLCGGEINIKEYKMLEKEKTPPVNVANPGFEDGDKGWKMSGGSRVEDGAGSVASRGLVYERTDSTRYHTLGQRRLDIVPGKTYNFSVMVRGEDIKDVNNTKIGRGATFCVELVDKDGKWMTGGIHPKGVRGTADWTRIEINNFKIPEHAGGATLTFYLDRNMVGKAWFDDVKVTPAESSWTVYPANTPMLRAAPGQQVKLVFSNDGKSIMKEAAPGKLYAYAEWNGRPMSAPILGDRAELQLPADALGEGKMNVKILDSARKLILEESEFPLNIGPVDSNAPSYCHFDGRKRAIVNGKKFLPVGVFGNAHKKSELALLKDAGFNTLVLYNSTSMGFSSAPRSYERAAEVFDFCEENDLKIVFAIKNMYASAGRFAITSLYGDDTPEKIVRRIVSIFKDRPALLAWYTCDEFPNQMIPELTERRQLLNQLDPNHPAWALCALGYTTESLEIYGPAADAIGADAYPIRSEYSIRSMIPKLEEGVRTGLPHWFTLQMFNMRRYFPKATDAEQCRFPSEKEFRAMILLAAGYEVNGYFFYSDVALTRPDAQKDGDPAANMDAVRKGIRLLHGLEPFLLSDKPVVKLPVKTVKGDVLAWRFSDDGGKSKVFAVALGPGGAEAEITLDSPETYRSDYGLSTLTGGKWIFKANDIDSDILSN